MAIVTGYKIGKEIADALGIKHCRRLDIHIPLKEIVTIEAEFYPEIDGVKQLLPILKTFALCEKKPEDLNESRHWRNQMEKKPLKDIAITEPPIGIDGEPINPMEEYGMDGDKVSPPKNFVNERDLK